MFVLVLSDIHPSSIHNLYPSLPVPREVTNLIIDTTGKREGKLDIEALAKMSHPLHLVKSDKLGIERAELLDFKLFGALHRYLSVHDTK